ncbi:glucose 1-dehydrogenase [Conexibacter sp. CPCC 206217]|uniref:glucose 1-dehydrogenase n=1 Tax=Conexibacter sp. CPCC 206217 TaxID=3064574 RepID=UPI002728FECF|nr:glucose 1-dehydrogenase [Conexibacter sp. CPCC 206217]MDO8211904.1 glucose 1-dehydrogenase [Conexibacter sp. CPCC 206217]
MSGRLDGKTCLITGAGRGIGAAIAQRLAADGANVAVVDLDSSTAEQVAGTLDGRGLGIGADVADRAAIAGAIAQTVERFGRLDVMFNNAGISQTKPFLEVTEDEYMKIQRVNGLGVLIGTQESAKQFIAQGGGGKIVNTASMAGKQGFPLFAAYCASKFGVVALTQAGARGLAEHGITVNAFGPGVVQTELWEQLDSEFREHRLTERRGQALEEFGEGILLGRLSTPDDIVGIASFLASGDSDYITGQAIQVDGGMVLS